MLACQKVEQSFGLQISSRENLLTSDHGGCIGKSPGIGVEHGHGGEDRIVAAEMQLIGQGYGQRMKCNGTVRVENALGLAGGSRGVAHRGRIILGEIRVARLSATLRKKAS